MVEELFIYLIMNILKVILELIMLTEKVSLQVKMEIKYKVYGFSINWQDEWFLINVYLFYNILFLYQHDS